MKRTACLALTLLAGSACQKNPDDAQGKEPVAQESAALSKPPETELAPVGDTYHGTIVSDPYRWLEGTDPKVKAWSEAQNAYARAYLDKLPGAPALRTRIEALLKAEVTSFAEIEPAGSRFIVRKRQPPKQQPFLVVIDGLDSAEGRVLLDPTVLDPAGTTAIDWFVASPDGKLVAVSISKGGTESGDVQVYEIDSGKPVDVVIPRVNGGTAGGSLAWAKDGKGFFYTRYPRGEERPAEDRDFYQQLWFHALGTPGDADKYEMGKDLPRIGEIQVDVDEKSGRVLATVQNGDGGEFEHHLRSPDGKWQKLTGFTDKIVQMAFGPKDDLYLISRADAPKGKILRMPIGKPDWKSAEVVIPEGEDTIVSDFWGAPTVLVTDSKIYVEYQLGGPSTVRAFDLAGKPAKAPDQLDVAAVGGLMRVNGETILFNQGSFLEPAGYYRFDGEATSKTALINGKVADFTGVEVVREMATSKDGTKVPVNFLIPKGFVRDGNGALVVTGYGGYGVNLEPRYNASYLALLEKGVAVGVANLRGGSEYGSKWKEEGRLTKKQNVFDDLIAVLQFAIDQKITNRARLGITGGSNGGLLMGAVMTQRPDLIKAVVSFVGIYDMLRVELSSNGAFNVTEFGTVKDLDQFTALYAYSPYHKVKEHTPYPPTLFLTGENDPRVDPMQSRKMTARLQAVTRGSVPILLRTSQSTGHGGSTGLDERVAQTTDAYAFMLEQLGVR